MRYRLRKGISLHGKLKPRKVLLLSALLISIVLGVMLYNRVIPDSSAESLKNEAISVINEQVNSCVEEYLSENPDFEDKCISAKRDGSGRIISYTASADLLERAENEILENLRDGLEKNSTVEVKLPIGSLTGNRFFEGLGFPVTVRANIVPAIKSEVTTSLESAGINQSLYKAVLKLEITCQVMRHGESSSFSYSSGCNLLQLLIMGDVPLTDAN